MVEKTKELRDFYKEVPHGEISPKVFSLAPVIVDQLLPAWLEERESIQDGYHVGSSATFFEKIT